MGLDPSGTQPRPTAEPTIVERARAILRDELATGALANVADSSRIWATHRPGLVGAEFTRHVRTDLEELFELVLDLLASPHAGAITELRSPRTVAPGQMVAMRTRLANETAEPVELGLRCSDLLAEAGGRIQAECVRVSPSQVRIQAGDMVDIEIGLHVPTEARPGRYRALLEASNGAGLRAQVTLLFHSG